MLTQVISCDADLGNITSGGVAGSGGPGILGVFDTITPGVNNLLSENFQLGPDGDIAFQNVFVDGSQHTFGTWHVKTDNTIEEIIVRGTVAPEFGGGGVTVSTTSTAWNSGGRFPVWARISGGTFTDGIFLFVPTISTNTPAGTGVPVSVVDATTGATPVSLAFAHVTQPGETALTTASGGPALPTAFALGDPPVF